MYLMMIYIVGAVFFVWLVLLTIITLNTKAHYDKLVTRTRKESIDEILDVLLENQKKLAGDNINLKKELLEEISSSKLHIQKIGLVRFNPFERMGGEQSFIIALLDKEKNGLTLNFIYTKEGLRVYTKKIKNGKGEEYDLSEEEKKAIEKSS
jgi:hypothetical protein